MFKVIQSFSGLVSGTIGEIITLKDKEIIKDLLNAGYIEEYNEKNQNNTELKKGLEKLKKENQELKEQIESHSVINLKTEDEAESDNSKWHC